MQAVPGEVAGCNGRRKSSKSMLSLDCHQKWRMLFNSRRAFIIQAVGISTVFLSVAAVVVLFFAT